MNLYKSLLIFFVIFSLIACNKKKDKNNVKDYSQWSAYAGSKEGIRYSSHDEINLSNIKNLEVAWSYSSGDKDSLNRSQNQCNPIIVDGILYGSSPKSKLLALHAGTGIPLWIFDPAELDSTSKDDTYQFFKVNRGVVYWQDEMGNNKRVFYNVGSKVFAIDALTGKSIVNFGKKGFIDLAEGLSREPGSFNPYIANTSPGIIFENLLILGSRVAESADAAPGDIRAYNVLTGEKKWTFHTIPHPGEPGYETWPDKNAYEKLGGANSWAGMALDEKRGIVYVPTGSVSGDFYGGLREGTNLYGNSLLALDAKTGKYKWHFQTVHHDLWDRDLSANPNLVTVTKDGERIDAVAQITKQGFIFLFNRITGEPLFPIDEIPFPQDALPGEKPWSTQPIPQLPEPFARQVFEEEDVTNLTQETHQEMLRKFKQIKHTQMFYPPSKEGSWIFPGFDGGGQWGGAAVDPETEILYVNSSELPWSMVMMDIPKNSSTDKSKTPGRDLYDKYCIACHGKDLKGNGISYPSLENIGNRYKPEEIKDILNNGMNMMPAFNQLSKQETQALINYMLKKEPVNVLLTREPESMAQSSNKILDQIPYQMTGYNRFLDDEGYPGIKPPWGTLNAVDLKTGKLLWKVPLGEYPELTTKGHSKTGTENYGGPVVTKGGLVFIAATKDSKIRAFNKKTGEEVWSADLPVPGYATPAVYSVNGKQYVVIATGGGKIGSPSGDTYIAFSLKNE